MKIRDREVLLPTTAINAFPRPHWLQGRILGILNEPVYRSHNLRVAYEDAVKICAHEQELACLDILCDGQAIQGGIPRPGAAERDRR